MSTSTEPKPSANEETESEKTYSVEEEDDDSEAGHFPRVKPSLLKTPSILNSIIDQIHPDVLAKSHQSNFILFPPKLDGCTVVDIGCGVGRDAFILSKLVGEDGRVIGIDSEKHQLDFARSHIHYHMEKFELKKVNVEFLHGETDELEKTKLKENSVDLVVSNSVVNYKRNKKAIIEGVCKILKPGGEFYFSDVYVNRPIPLEYQDLLAGDYVGGALRWEDLILYATEAGFTQPRLVISKPIIIDDADIQQAIGKARFVSAIFRCFKILCDDNDSTKFDKPYQLTYETPLPSAEEEFFFDHSLQFKLGDLLVITDPSVALELSLSRYKDNFIFDPIDDSNSETVTIIETIEERSSSPTGNDENNGGVYRKTTTTTITT